MKTKKIFLICIGVFTSLLVMTQNAEKPAITFAVLAGPNFQNFSGKDFNGNDLNGSGIVGFHAGVNAQIRFVPDFYFQPGLLYSTKGAEIKDNLITGTYKLTYLELPLNLVYKSSLGSGYIMLGFGPYVGYGIKGNATYVTGSGSVDSKVEFKNVVEANDPLTNTYIKKLDVGANAFAGYEMAGGLFIQLNTQFGLINISPDDTRFPEGETALKNIGFGLSLGYRF